MSSAKKPLKLHPMIEKKYKIIREIGRGAYGIVCAASNIETKQNVAIKKVAKIFDKPILAKRALRELKLLRHFRNHENITSIFEMEIPEESSFTEIYFIQELMEADLHQIIRSEQPLTDAHYQYFVYQVLRGLKYIHSANVLHRDLKPGNLLVNADCELKICDFGLARGFSTDPEGNAGFMTEYVATRWYRAPEIMLCFHSYTKAIDLWSVGCILAEMLGGRPLFKGRDYVDQLNQVLAILGMPDEATLAKIGSQRAQLYIRALPKTTKVPFSQLYPKANPLAIDLLEKLLQFDPSKRPTVEEALAHEYLKAYHDPTDEPSHPKTFDFSFEQITDMAQIKELIKEEIANWKMLKTSAIPHMSRRDTLTGPNRDNIKDVDMSDDEVGLVAQKVENNNLNDDELERELSGNIMGQ